MYRKFYIDNEILQEIIARVEELQTIKLERFERLPLDTDMRRNEEITLNHLTNLVTRFRDEVRYSETERDENEQLAAIGKLMKEISHDAGYGYGSRDLVEQLKHYFETLKDNKHSAYKTFAKLVDDQRVKLLAVQFLLESVPHSATHKTKDFKVGMVQEVVTAIIEELSRVNKDKPEYYNWRHSDVTGSWDYAQALADLHHQSSNIKRLEEELEAARAKLAKYEPVSENSKSTPVEEEINF